MVKKLDRIQKMLCIFVLIFFMISNAAAAVSLETPTKIITGEHKQTSGTATSMNCA